MKSKAGTVDARHAKFSSFDAKEITTFIEFMRLVSEAERAGVTRAEAAVALYPDVYPDASGMPEKKDDLPIT